VLLAVRPRVRDDGTVFTLLPRGRAYGPMVASGRGPGAQAGERARRSE
jgi:hypothetical protein